MRLLSQNYFKKRIDIRRECFYLFYIEDIVFLLEKSPGSNKAYKILFQIETIGFSSKLTYLQAKARLLAVALH